jgi:hypothetical protein
MAAGTGKGFEVKADILREELNKHSIDFSSTCTQCSKS